MANGGAPHEIESRPQSRREWSGWLTSLVLPLALVVSIVGVLLYIDSRGGDDANDDAYGSVELPAERNHSGRAPAAEESRAAPDFRLEQLSGGDLRLSDLQGQPLIVNFWATWCGPCRVEMPSLVVAHLTHQTQGLVVLAVNEREAGDRVRPFAEEFELPFPILMDRDGEVAATWRIGGAQQGLPSSYFIDRQGIVRKVVYGSLTARILSDGLALILEEPSR